LALQEEGKGCLTKCAFLCTKMILLTIDDDNRSAFSAMQLVGAPAKVTAAMSACRY
jgi:hypothetical protein